MDGVKTLANAVIAQTPMSGFVSDARRVHVVCYAYEARAGRLYPPEEVVARARSRIGHKRYDLLYDNCESCTLEVRGGGVPYVPRFFCVCLAPVPLGGYLRGLVAAARRSWWRRPCVVSWAMGFSLGGRRARHHPVTASSRID